MGLADGREPMQSGASYAAMSASAVLLILGVEALVVAALAASRHGARAGATLALLLLPLPAFVAAPPFARALLGVAFFLIVVRALEMVRDGPPGGFARRLVHLVAVVDTRAATAVRATSPLGLVAGVIWLAVTAMSVVVIQEPGHFGLARPALWLVVAAGLLGALEGMHALTGFVGGRVLGVAVPPLSLQPYRSATLAEFWGQRWNPVISGILREHCFTPLRRSPRAALTAAFVGSALLHWYLALVSLDATMALAAGAFFVAQAPMLFIERKLAVRRWPYAAGLAWTLGVLLLLWPLLAEPIVRVFRG